MCTSPCQNTAGGLDPEICPFAVRRGWDQYGTDRGTDLMAVSNGQCKVSLRRITKDKFQIILFGVASNVKVGTIDIPSDAFMTCTYYPWP